jgi:hypothetical protein
MASALCHASRTLGYGGAREELAGLEKKAAQCLLRRVGSCGISPGHRGSVDPTTTPSECSNDHGARLWKQRRPSLGQGMLVRRDEFHMATSPML